MENKSIQVDIQKEMDVKTAMLLSKKKAIELDFKDSDAHLIATAVSELAKNILTHAGGGQVTISTISYNDEKCIEVVAQDTGPGIKNIPKALQDHYSTAGTLGLGLPAVKRMMDEFFIDSESNLGTKIIARKWRS